MKGSSFFEIFPPPSFLTMPTFGLSIDGANFRSVSYVKKHGHYLLESAKEFKIEGAVFGSGEIAKPDKVVTALKKVADEQRTRFVSFALPEENAYVYEAIVPLPDDGNINEAVEFSMDQNIPLPAAEAVSDFAVVEGPFSHNDVRSVKVVVSAYSRSITETWVELFNQAGLVPVSMMSESQALAHSVVVRGDRRPFLLVNFLKNKALIAIISEGLVRFATVVSSNEENISKALSAHDGERVAESVELLAVRDEVKKVFSYWMSKSGAKSSKEPRGLKSLVVTGHVSNMGDISDYISKHVGIPATLGNVWQNAFPPEVFVPTIEFDESLAYAISAGAALPINK